MNKRKVRQLEREISYLVSDLDILGQGIAASSRSLAEALADVEEKKRSLGALQSAFGIGVRACRELR